MAALQQTPITFQSRSPPPTQLINGPIAKLSFSGGLKLPKLTIKLRSKRISRRGGGALGAKMSASAAGSYALSLADVAKSNETLEQTSTDLEKLEQISKKTRTQKKPKMANSTIQFGILGCADIARKVSRAILLSQTATLYAVGSRSIEKAKKFAADNNFPATAKVYGSYDEVLDDPNVDAVYVPLPTSLHIKWAVAAAQKKKHLLLEKPVALNVEEVDVILEACESNGVQFMDGTVWMHHPRTAKMREFLSDLQKFGELKLVLDVILEAC